MQTTHNLRARVAAAARQTAQIIFSPNRQTELLTTRRAALGGLLLLALFVLPHFTPGMSALVGQAKRFGGELTQWVAAPTAKPAPATKRVDARLQDAGLGVRLAESDAALPDADFFRARLAPVDTFALAAGPTCKVISGYVYEDTNDNGVKDSGEPPIVGVTLNLYNASNVVVATTTTDGTGFYSFSTDSTISTATQTSTQTFTIPNNFPTATVTNWARNLTLNKFDPNLGMLTKVSFNVAASETSLIRVESLDAAATTITATVSGFISVNGPSLGSPITAIVNTPAYTFNATCFDGGALDYGCTAGGPAGCTCSGYTPPSPTTGMATAMGMLTDPTDNLAPYIGSGTVTLNASALAASGASGSGNLNTNVMTTAGAVITVTYTYMPTNCLQPGTYTIRETQPTGYLDGLDNRGPTNGGDVITGSRGTDAITVTLAGSDIPQNNFGELPCSSFHTTLNTAVCANSTGNVASVPNAGTGATYVWMVTGGTITSGQGTNTITYTAGPTGPIIVTVTVTNSPSCAGTLSDSDTVTVNPAPTANAGPDLALCQTVPGPTVFTVNGSVTNGTPAWTVMGTTGGASATIGSPGSATTSVNVTGTGTVTLKLTATSNTTPACGTAEDTVVLTVNPNPIANAGQPQTLCQTLPGPTLFTVNGTATNGTPAWTVQGTTGGASANITNPNSASTGVSVTGTGTITLRLTVTSSFTPSCGAVTSDVVLTVNPQATANAGPDQTACQTLPGPTVFTLAGAATNGTPAWSVQSTTGGASATITTPSSLTSTVNVTGTGTVTLLLNVTNGNSCNASDTVVLTVNPSPQANAGNDQQACQTIPGPTAFNLVGTIAGGTPAWTVTGTTGGATATIGNPNSATTGVNVTGTGTVTLTLTVTSNTTPSCGTATDTVTLTVTPSPTANAGPDQTLCQTVPGPTVFTLAGTATNGTPAWTVQSATGTASATVVTPGSLTSQVNVTGVGTVTLLLTTTSNTTPSCGTATDTVVLAVNTNPTANAGPDQTLCQTLPGPTVFTLAGAATFGTGAWSVQSTTGTANATIVTPTSLTSAVNVMGTGTVTLRLTVTSNATPGCGTATDDVVLTVNPQATANAGPDQALCQTVPGPTVFTLAGTASNGTPAWSVQSTTGGASATLTTPSSLTSTVNVTGTGTVTLLLNVTNGNSCNASDTVVLTVNANPAADAGPDQTLCQVVPGPTVFTLAGTASNGTPAWTVQSSTGTAAATILAPSSLTSGVNVTGVGTVTLKLTVTSGGAAPSRTVAVGCGMAMDTVTLTVNPLPTANAGSDQTLCQTNTGPTVFTLAGTAANGTPAWSVVTSTGTANATITTPSSLTSTVSVTGVGTVTLRLTTTSNQTPSCGTATDDVVLAVNSNPTANAGPDQALCQAQGGTTAFTLAGAATFGTSAWSVFATTGTASATITTPSSLTSGVNVTGIGTVTLRLTVTSNATPGCGTATDDVVLTVRPNPTANAGPDQALCQTVPGPTVFTLAGAATNGTGAWSVFSTTGGATATITTPSSLTSTVSVTGTGTVTLRLTTTSNQTPSCGMATDDVVLTVNGNPTANAGTPQTLCQTVPGPTVFNLNGTATNGTPAWSVMSTTGTAAATVVTPSSLTSAVNVTGVGTVTLKLTTTSGSTPACATATSTVVLTVNPNPTADAGPDQTICQLGGPPIVFTLAGAVTNGTGLWSVVGSTGTAVATIVTPTNLASTVNVVGVGTVTLRLTTTSNQTPSCGTATDDVVLTASQAATVDAGPDQTVSACAASVQLAGKIGGAATSATWSGGQGTFSPNANTLNAVYTPSPAEKASGATVVLTLTTNDPPGVCNAVSDTVAIKLQPCANLNPSVLIIDPGVCIEPGTTLDLRATLVNTGTATQGDNPGNEFTTNLPAQLLPLAGSCSPSSGACQISGGQFVWNGSIPVGGSVTINFRVQVAGVSNPAAEFCLTVTTNYDYDNNGTNESSRTSAQACVRASCPPPGPGQLFPPDSEISDQKAGSILIYPIYTSSTSTPNTQNTRISITNTDLTRDVAVHLFFVDGATCSVADAYICLTRGQTTSLLASEYDPDSTGYVIGIATDTTTGCPINFNHLIGDEFVKFGSGHAANLGAEAVSAVPGTVPACDGNASVAVINFDGRAYNALPRVLAASSVLAPDDGNETLLILNRIGGDLMTGAARLTDVFGILYNDLEAGFSFSFNPNSCQFRSVLSNSIPRTVPRFSGVIPAGRTGWMKLYSNNDQAIVGAIINRNANAGSAGAFNQGRSLHKLRLTTGASITIPVFPPVCR